MVRHPVEAKKKKLHWSCRSAYGLVRRIISRVFASKRRRRRISWRREILRTWTEARWSPLDSDTPKRRFLALQPIFTREREIFGYEALSRSGWDNEFVGDSDAATQTIVDDKMLHGLDRLTGGSSVFLNCTREVLVGGSLAQLPNSIVLELLETVEPDEEVLGACRRMKALGYQIALDDFEHCQKMEGLIELADYIKVDFRLSGKEQRGEILSYLRGKAVLLLAEKIESEEEFNVALEEGFHLFQGYYLGRPKVFRKKTNS